MTGIKEILAKHRLRKTNSRCTILDLFIKEEVALSHADLEQKVGENFDRVTIYRTLASFEEHGLIHKVPDENGIAKYALCSHNCSVQDHHDAHIHFNCTACNKTYCLDEVPVPEMPLPEGYKAEELKLLVQGTCTDCS